MNIGLVTNLVVNEPSEGEVVKEVRKVCPDGGTGVLSKALVVKTVYLSCVLNYGLLGAVHLSNLTAFVITTQDSYSVRVADLDGRISVPRTRIKAHTLRATRRDTASTL